MTLGGGKMTRKNETWIQDKFAGMYGIEAFMPEVLASLEEKGYKHTDLKRVISKTRNLRSMPKAWRHVAKQQENYAVEAENRGHLVTAREMYHRAALYYGKAQLYFHQDSPRKKEMHADMVRCYKKVCEYSTYRLERVEIPFQDKKIYAVLHLPDTDKPVPAVLLVPGMDMIKEDYPNPNDNQFLNRGMAVMSIDGPGQGETRVNGLTVTLDNYQQAGKAAIDFLTSLPEVDSEKIGIFGISMGSYWGPLITAHDDRVKACVAMLGCYLDKDRIFNSAQPGFRKNYMFMSGIYDDEAFDRMAKEMTLAKVADRIKAAMLLACGEYDDLCPPEQVKEFFDMLDCPKEMWILEDEFHPCGGVAPELYPWAIDWLKDRLVGGGDQDLKKEVFIESRY
jgi:dipeptidyl aminopeptidase/acylaminoacyl peptidase